MYLQHSQGPQCAKDDVRRGNALRGHHHCQFSDCKVGVRDGQDLYGPEVAEPVLRVVNRKPLRGSTRTSSVTELPARKWLPRAVRGVLLETTHLWCCQGRSKVTQGPGDWDFCFLLEEAKMRVPQGSSY